MDNRKQNKTRRTTLGGLLFSAPSVKWWHNSHGTATKRWLTLPYIFSDSVP